MNFKLIFGLFALAFVALVASQSWFKTEVGYNYVVQNTWTENVDVLSGAGTHGRLPFFTIITRYKQVATVNLSGVNRNLLTVAADVGNFTRQQPATEVAFADTYTGDISATFRFRLPTDKEGMLRIHSEFRSFDNMVDGLLVRNAIDVMVVTATQYTGEEFFQGGVNAYKVQLVDQLRNGLYETVRRQVTIQDTAVAPVSVDNSDANQLQAVTRKIWKSVILENDEGVPYRQTNPFDQYGIVATQVTLGKPQPDASLDNLLDNKRDLVAQRISAVEQLTTNAAEAAAVQQKEEIETVRQVQIAQRESDLAVIASARQVAVEREVSARDTVIREREKALAVIDKQRELEIASANRDIQAAAAQAAEFEASAIRAIGLANADVTRAQLAAKQDARDIYMAELNRDIAQVMYPALEGVTIDMPDFYMGGAGSDAGMPNSLEVFRTLAAIQSMEDVRTANETITPVE